MRKLCSKNQHLLPYIIGPLLGLWGFWYIFGFVPLDSSNINWMLEGDPAQHYLGWSYFRAEPWGWPLGKFTTLNAPEGSSIVYTDSLPLFAFFFKLFDGVLPTPFQYKGYWGLFCYLMTGLGGVKLFLRITKSWALSVVGTFFILLSPVMALRILGHYTLAGHWLIIFSLYLYLKPFDARTKSAWGVLAVTASLVHFYLLAMVLAIWLAYLFKNAEWSWDKNMLKRMGYPALLLTTVLFSMWAAGYFVIPGSASGGSVGYGALNLNLAALWNPHVDPVGLLDQIPVVNLDQWEGYNYLGAGLLLMILISLIMVNIHFLVNLFKRHKALAIVFLGLFVFAVSNRVTLGSHLLFSVNLSEWVVEKASILRSSGRMFWPIYYAFYLFPFIVFRKHVAACFGVAVFCLSVQFVDLSPYLSTKRLGRWEMESTLKSPVWEQLLEGRRAIAFAPAEAVGDDYLPFAFLANEKGMTFNTGYFARVDLEQRSEKSDKVIGEIVSGNLDPETLYILRKNMLIKPNGDGVYTSGILDGYPFIAPGVEIVHEDIGDWGTTIDIDSEKLGLTDLVSRLEENDYLFVSVRDDAFSSLSQEWKLSIDERGGELSKLQFRGSYAAIVGRDGVLEEALENEGEALIERNLFDRKIRIVSGGQQHGNLSEIEIDGKNFSINGRGLNVVLWNSSTNSVRRYCFDTCAIVDPISTSQ